MHLVHKRYTTKQFLTVVLNMITLIYSENPLEKMQKVFLIVMVNLNRTRPEVYSLTLSQSVLVN